MTNIIRHKQVADNVVFCYQTEEGYAVSVGVILRGSSGCRSLTANYYHYTDKKSALVAYNRYRRQIELSF